MFTKYNYLIDVQSGGENLAAALQENGFANIDGKPLEICNYCPSFKGGLRIASWKCLTKDFNATISQIKSLAQKHDKNSKINIAFLGNIPKTYSFTIFLQKDGNKLIKLLKEEGFSNLNGSPFNVGRSSRYFKNGFVVYSPLFGISGKIKDIKKKLCEVVKQYDTMYMVQLHEVSE